MINLEKYQQAIEELCELLKVQTLELFGSAVRDDFTEGSDVDVVVMFFGEDSLFDRFFDLKYGLEKIFKRSVDVVMAEAIKNPYFIQAVNKDRRLIYGTRSKKITV